MALGLWLWNLTVEGWRPDQRLSINGRRRLHPQQVGVLTRSAKERVMWAIRGELNQRPISGPYVGLTEVQIRFAYKIRRRRDPDNCAGMAKPILDALVAEGLIRDDSSEHIRLVVSAEVGLADYTRIDLAGRAI